MSKRNCAIALDEQLILGRCANMVTSECKFGSVALTGECGRIVEMKGAYSEINLIDLAK